MTEDFLSRSPCLLHKLAATALAVAASFVMGAPRVAQAQPASPAATPAAVKADPGGPRWVELSPAHRQVLAPLAKDWEGLDARSKERWIDVAGRYPRMKPEEQQRANQRMEEWSRMTVAQRMQARTNFQEFRSLPRQEREERWKAYQALPEEEKRKLAAKRAAPAPTAASAPLALRRRAPPPLNVVQPKNNVVAPVRGPAGSAPAAVQRPGVTTTLLTRRASPPAHQKDGAPKIAVGPNAVDRTTLLPRHTTVAEAAKAASAPPAAHR